MAAMISSSIRTTLSLPQTRKGRWLNPELSVGKYLGVKKRKYHYWEAEGPALEAFERIKPQITAVLESACAPVPGSRFISFNIFLIGETPETAVPNIMFSCEHSNPRKSAMNLIKESKILDQCQSGICLGQWNYPPHLKNLRFLASSKIYMSRGNEMNLSLCDYNLIPASDSKVPRENLPLQIELRNPSARPGYLCQATIGGIVELSGRRFYLAPAHVFSPQWNSSQDMPETYPQSEDSDCEFGRFDDENESLVDDQEAEFMSQFSFTPESSHSEHGLDPSCTESSSDVVSDALNFEEQSERQNNSITRSDDGVHHLHEADNPVSSRSGCPDILFQSDDLDYCLIEVDKNDHCSSSLPVLSQANIGQLDNKDVGVTAFTGSGNVLKGIISNRRSCIRLPSATRYIDVLSVQFEDFLQPGDSGSIVRDANTGKIYGHIIAGDTESQNALIVPAGDILADVMANSRRTEMLSSHHDLPSILSTLNNESPHPTMTQSSYTAWPIPPGSFISFEDLSMTSWDHIQQQDSGLFDTESVQTNTRPESDLKGISPRFCLPDDCIPQYLEEHLGAENGTTQPLSVFPGPQTKVDRPMLGIPNPTPSFLQPSHEAAMAHIMNVYRRLVSNRTCSHDEVTEGVESLEVLKTFFNSNRGKAPMSSNESVYRDREKYQCLLCEAQKKRKAIVLSFGSLKKHLSTMHGIHDSEFRCPTLDCPRTFYRRDRMREHLTLIHKQVDLKAADVEATRVRGPPPVTCLICPETIQSWDAFFRHIKNHCLVRSGSMGGSANGGRPRRGGNGRGNGGNGNGPSFAGPRSGLRQPPFYHGNQSSNPAKSESGNSLMPSPFFGNFIGRSKNSARPGSIIHSVSDDQLNLSHPQGAKNSVDDLSIDKLFDPLFDPNFHFAGGISR
jgi:hypothetical protein